MAVKKRNVWKYVVIISIVIFTAIIALGMFRVHQFKSSFTEATEAQKEIARNSAITDLQNRGEDIDSFQITVGEHIRVASRNSPSSQQVIDVIAYNDSQRHLYIMNAQSGSVLLYSKTEFHDGMNHSVDDAKRGRQRTFFGR